MENNAPRLNILDPNTGTLYDVKRNKRSWIVDIQPGGGTASETRRIVLPLSAAFSFHEAARIAEQRL